MDLPDKIAQAHRLIDTVMATARNPVVMSSFGKDSMVMLHLLRDHGLRLPVVFHREPMLPKKYAFANSVIQDWELTVYDYPPTGTAIQMEGECVEVVNAYPAGAKPMLLPTGICDPVDGEPTLCALHDFYLKPLGLGFNTPWDLAFVGHKSSDVDPVYGAIPLKADYHTNIGSPSLAFPIRYFTDADVWTYHEKLGVPIHTTRYEKTGDSWKERADKTHNPDYFPACTACMKPDGGPVACPRLNGATVSNVSKELRWLPRQNLSYMESVPQNA